MRVRRLFCLRVSCHSDPRVTFSNHPCNRIESRIPNVCASYARVRELRILPISDEGVMERSAIKGLPPGSQRVIEP